MNVKRDKEDAKIDDESDPLCLFYFPRSENKTNTRESYRSSTRGLQESKTQKLAESPWTTRKSNWKYQRNTQQREHVLSKSSSDEAALPNQTRKPLDSIKCSHRGYERRTKERRVQRKPKSRRFGKEPVHNLTSYLLSSVKTPPVLTQDQLPSITQVLDTITEAWQENNRFQNQNLEETPEKICGAAVMLERRRSVPEEIIRKFTVNHDRTSESEANITMPEATSPSSKESEAKEKETLPGAIKLKSNVFSNKIKEESFWLRSKDEKSFSIVDDPNILRSAEEGSSDSDSDAPGMERFNTIKRAPFRRESVIDDTSVLEPKPNQSDYYKNGKGILKMAAVEKSCQTNDYPHSNESRTTLSPWEESDSAESSETIFSSPRFCTRPLSSSDNLSSDSECIKCTCAEIVSSKDTSTDLYHSGKSTLSQTVSDKSTSTQDSTASINSVSSRGSSISVATDSSTTDVDPRTSAKETTTSADNTPRTPKEDRGRDNSRDKGDQSKHSRHCPQHKQNDNTTINKDSNNKQTRDESEQTDKMFMYNSYTELSSRVYEWAQFSEEELKVLQQQRHKKFLENNRNFNSILSNVLTADNLKIAADVGSSYTDVETELGLPSMVPRYSALPRTMSMLVNSSSYEHGQLSDSDCQSLADSLEDGQNRKEQCFYDTKQELKPVRGEVKTTAEKKRFTYKNEPRGRAYFFSVDDEGKAELVTNIHKIPELPKQIKNKIHKRHLSICKNTDHKEKTPKEDGMRGEGFKKTSDKSNHGKKTFQRRSLSNRKSNDKPKSTNTKEEKMSTKRRNEPPLLPLAHKKEINETKIEKAENEKEDNNSKQSTQLSEKENEKKFENRTEIGINSKAKDQESTSNNFEPKPSLSQLSKHRDELISSLETTAALLKNQQNVQKPLNKSQQNSKRIGRFQQRFEVIPEERSSSLTSSAEDRRSEKNRRRSLPVKLIENVKPPAILNTDTENKSFRRYTLGSIPSSLIAKLMGRPLQAIPCVQHGPNNQSQQIIIFSPKDSSEKNSSKGRDALLAMNREDFNRLSKGWMNFYLLKESSESDNEDELEEENKNQLDGNTIVCHIPSMEKDPSTTSESCTDGTMTPPNINKTFSLLQQGTTANSFRLQQIPENSQEENMTQNNSLCLIREEPELNYTSQTLETIKENEIIQHEKIRTEVLKTPKDIKKIAEKVIERKETKEVATCTDRIFKKKVNVPPLQLTAPIKLTSSNTVLNIPKGRNSPSNIPKSTGRTCSLPELNTDGNKKSAPVKTKSMIESLPKVPGVSSDSENSDSDSTVYMEAPSPRIPRLPLEDCYSSESSTPSEKQHLSGVLSREKQNIPFRRRPLPFRPKNRYSFHESTHGKKPGSGWSVTVEGTLAFPRARPGVQMRLSFPGEAGPPTVSQSDSGFVEDRDTTSRTKMQQKQQWTVTVKNPKSVDGVGKEKTIGVHLPNLSKRSDGDIRRGSKENSCEIIKKQQIEIGKKLSKIWPKVKEVIESEIKSIAEELILDNEEDRPLLSVEGRAMSFDTKPRFQTNSQRDITRSNTARSEVVKANVD